MVCASSVGATHQRHDYDRTTVPTTLYTWYSPIWVNIIKLAVCDNSQRIVNKTYSTEILTSSFDGKVIYKRGVAVDDDGHIHIRLDGTCVWENKVFLVLSASANYVSSRQPTYVFGLCWFVLWHEKRKYETTGICLTAHPYDVERRLSNYT